MMRQANINKYYSNMLQKDLSKERLAAEMSEQLSTNEVVLQKLDNERWVVYAKSGFIVRLLLSAEGCKCYLSDDVPCVEVNSYGIYQLTVRAEQVEAKGGQMQFKTPPVSGKFNYAYNQWKNGLNKL